MRQEDRLLNLSYWIDLLARRRWLVLGTTGAVLFSAMAFSLTQPQIYEAACTMLLNRQRVQAINVGDLYTKQPLARANELLMAQMEVLMSTPVLEMAVRDLEESGAVNFEQPGPGEEQGQLTRIRIALGVEETPAPLTSEDRRRGYVRNLKERMAVFTKGGNAFLVVTVVSRDPKKAANSANAIAAAYLKHDREMLRHSADEAVEWLSGRLREQRDKLLEAEERMRASAGSEPRLDEMNQLTIQEVSRLQGALLEVRLGMLQTQTGGAGEPTSGASDGPAVGGSDVDTAVNSALRDKVQQELVETIASLDKLRRTYGENHPDVLIAAEKEKMLRQDLSRLNALVPRRHSSDGSRLLTPRDVEALRAQENLLQRQLDGMLQTASAKGEAGMRYAILKREVEINRSLYNEMLTRLNEITISAGLDPAAAEIFEPAQEPETPISPKHRRAVFLGMLVGLMLGVGAAALRDHLDQSLRDPGQANDLLGVPVLGIIPDHRALAGRSALKAGSRLFVGRGEETVSAEAYRVLRSHIEGTLSREEARVLLLTSAVAGEGKSTTAANLAAAFAESGHRVLLIDSDFRRPTLRRLLGVELDDETSLSQVLAGAQPPERVILPSGVPALDFIGHRANDKIPDSARTTEAFQKLFAWARERYDHVIVDLPILMVAPGVTELGRAGGVVLLVHRPGWIPALILDQVREHLGLAKTRLLGVILNGTSARWASSQYLPAYYHAAYYSRKDDAT